MSELKPYLFHTLDHAHRLGGFSDAGGHVDRNIPELVELGYLRGEWGGSLDMWPPMRFWHITREGEKALHEFKMSELRRTVSKCAEGHCKGPYGSEIYLRTDCETCGHTIIREEKNVWG